MEAVMLVFMNALTEDLHWFFLSLRVGATGSQAPGCPVIKPTVTADPGCVITAVVWNKCFG